MKIIFSTFISRLSCLLSNSDEKWSDYLLKTLAATLATHVLREHISFGSLSAPRKTSNISQEFFILLLKRALISLKTSWNTSHEFGIAKCLFFESGSRRLGNLEILLNRTSWHLRCLNSQRDSVKYDQVISRLETWHGELVKQSPKCYQPIQVLLFHGKVGSSGW